MGTTEDNQKSDKLLQTAIEYNLRKVNTEKDINQVCDFQKKLLIITKMGGPKQISWKIMILPEWKIY